MKISKWIGWSAAGILSLGVHGALAAVFFAPGAEPETDGGIVAGEIALGSGFADLVQGALEPVSVDKVATTSTLVPTASATPRPDFKTVDMAQLNPLPRSAIHPPVTRAVMTPVATPVLAAVETPMVKPAPADIKPTPTAKPEVARLPPLPHKPVVKPVKDAKKPVSNPSARGNAKVNSKTGQDIGKVSGKQAEVSKTKAQGKAKNVGQGAERTYKRAVLRKIARVPKKKTGAKGKALVGMVIAANGQIASVGIVRSSGHAAIDRMAIDTVRRAKGFAPTPTGARMKLVVEMKSKG